MISIPSSFKLAGRTWTVEFVDCIDRKKKILGQTDSDTCVIQIRKDLHGEVKEHTFYHELCHAFCFTLGLDALNDDEGKIDALASVLYQYLKTKRGSL